MITIGIHIAYLTIRISRSYERLGDSSSGFDAVEWPSHSDTEWYAYYGGALPNAYDPASGNVGFDAIDEVGLAKAARLDSGFFRELLGSGAQHDRACRIWTGIQQSLRWCYALRVRQPVRAALLLDGIDLSRPGSRWTPWDTGADRTAEVEQQLTALGPRAAFAEFEVVTDRSALEGYAAAEDGMQPGDIVAMVGSTRTRLWEIRGTEGAVSPVCSTVGIEDLWTRLKRNRRLNSDTVKNLLRLLHGAERQPGTWPDLAEWQKNRLFPHVRRALKELPSAAPLTPRRLLAVGEGAALLQGLDVPVDRVQLEQWQTDDLFVPSHGAAALALEHSRGLKD